ncbi:MAG: DUF493 domain-containing protein [Myxococcaceae bacterium]|nr:DUF493 domain-containing protein [Myxococcaceae bacterium]
MNGDSNNAEKKEEQPGKPLIEYPTVYAFKVIGKQEHGFAEFVKTLFRRLMGSEISPDSISELPSRGNKYISLTVSVYLLSEEQRQTIYKQLHQERRILYYL